MVHAGAPHCPSGPSEFACADYVCVNLDLEVFQLMQEGHGGWNPAMADVRYTYTSRAGHFGLTGIPCRGHSSLLCPLHGIPVRPKG